MSKDLCVKTEDGILNIRVGAIIMKDGKFLMAGNDRFEHLYSVGGRVHFGETAEEAVVREVYEETGVKMEIDRLGFVHECFFITSKITSSITACSSSFDLYIRLLNSSYITYHRLLPYTHNHFQ